MDDVYHNIVLDFGEESVEAASVLNSQGKLYTKQELYGQGLNVYERSLKIRTTEMGQDHPNTIATRHNIGELYTQWGKPTKAQKYYNENIELMERKEAREIEKHGAAVKATYERH